MLSASWSLWANLTSPTFSSHDFGCLPQSLPATRPPLGQEPNKTDFRTTWNVFPQRSLWPACGQAEHRLTETVQGRDGSFNK